MGDLSFFIFPNRGQYRQYLATEEDLYVILEVDYHSYFVQKNIDRHQYIIGDGHRLLFSDESFDVISMFEVLEHVRNPFQIFANCARWLKPGGLIVLSAPQYWHVHGWPSDYFRYTIYGLKELANLTGLQVIDYWAMGGPCVLIFCVIELNFSSILRLPIMKQILRDPLLLIARFSDRLLFRKNLKRTNPDTRGWMCIIRKPTLESSSVMI
jgi:SAM-dependent methyltransferase